MVGFKKVWKSFVVTRFIYKEFLWLIIALLLFCLWKNHLIMKKKALARGPFYEK